MLRVERDLSVLERLIRNCKGRPVRILHDGVEYGKYQEFGTRRMAAHPFMGPALETVRPAYEAGIRRVDTWEDADNFVEKIARDAQGHARANAPVDTGQLKNSIDVTDGEGFLEGLQ